jgi:L-fuconate dehydratase
MSKITRAEAIDVRFPTSTMLDGSDAMNADPDYSAAYLKLHTDDSSLVGTSFVFTIGRGNDLQITAIARLAEKIVGRDIDECFTNIGAIARELSSDSQLRWLGPDTGVFHMGAGAVLTALWDLFAKQRGVPLWKLLADLTPEEIVAAIDFRYISDALSPAEALDLLKKSRSVLKQPTKQNCETWEFRPTPQHQAGSAIAMKKCWLSRKKRSIKALVSLNISVENL